MRRQQKDERDASLGVSRSKTPVAEAARGQGRAGIANRRNAVPPAAELTDPRTARRRHASPANSRDPDTALYEGSIPPGAGHDAPPTGKGGNRPPAGGSRRGERESSGRHPTVMAAITRQTTGRTPAVQPARAAHNAPGTPPPSPYGGRSAYGPQWDEPDAEADWSAGAAADAWDEADPPPDWDDWDARAGEEDQRSAANAQTHIIYDVEQGLYAPAVPRVTSPRLSPPRPIRNSMRMIQRAVAAVGQAALRGPLGQRVTLIPSERLKLSVSLPASPGVGARSRAGASRARRLAHPLMLAMACLALVLTVTATGAVNPGELAGLGNLWLASTGAHALPTPIGNYWTPPISSSAPAAPAPTNAGHYVAKYGFDWPGPPSAIVGGERQRLLTMLPFALAATTRWDARFGDTLEPQMLLFWTHAEGISANVNYSNCANEGSPPGTNYFSYITNCDTPSFWQLGYGNQFGVIDILKTAFIDMRGDPNNRALVQQVGQAVLNWDLRQGTTPRCGGYSCTFPALTIDEVMAGVSLSHETQNDWWASVLSRDPAINCYMLARALVWFNHNATRNWVGCYYAEPCWGNESNNMGDILAAWNSLRQQAGL